MAAAAKGTWLILENMYLMKKQDLDPPYGGQHEPHMVRTGTTLL